MSSSSPKASKRRRRGWVRRSDERLLELRFRDLDLSLQGTWLEGLVERIHQELEERGIRWKPHAWLSNEWFSPDGVPGIALPFYLAHERLMKLERAQMLSVEGGSRAECLRILRHEAGHAIDTAYRLHLKRRWQRLFGRWGSPYPETYRPRPNSRDYVVHLPGWYAQAHPAEDFAETFAVWLRPRSRWRRRYADWPRALAKLELVEELIGEIRGEPPKVRSRARIDPVARLDQTLAEHYREKRERYRVDLPEPVDRDLYRLFSRDPRHRRNEAAFRFLRGIRAELVASVASWSGVHAYTVDQILREMMDRCKALQLRRGLSRRETREQAGIFLTAQTLKFLHARGYEIPL